MAWALIEIIYIELQDAVKVVGSSLPDTPKQLQTYVEVVRESSQDTEIDMEKLCRSFV